ncbi:MAG: YnfC family lipoprotein [Enterobacteriaceae bacterium]|nr:YnfC family lipoprotein [Enterobacteriaceae bacterium]
MNKLLILIPFAALLAGCDEPAAPVAFTPEMAGFSSEFDFDPLRGPVKEFSQTLVDEKGEVAKRVSASMSKEGCFDVLELHDVANDSGVALILDANYYLDAQTHEKKLRTQGKCQLAELPAAGLSWETNDKGFITAAKGREVQIHYQYDNEGYPLGKISEAKDKRLKDEIKPSTDPRKKMDYTAVSLLNDKLLTRAKQSCDYDSHDNPVSCKLLLTDESASPAVETHYTIKYATQYY